MLSLLELMQVLHRSIPHRFNPLADFISLLKKLMFGFYRMNFFKLIVMKTAYFQPKSPEHLLGLQFTVEYLLHF